jgi:hypothetical protein
MSEVKRFGCDWSSFGLGFTVNLHPFCGSIYLGPLYLNFGSFR